MKRRSREVNIFSMSALDLFASALGAFILIAIVLFPFFPNIGSLPEEAREQLQTCRSDLAQSRAQLQAAQAELRESQNSLRQARAGLEQCLEELREQFMLIVISWASSDDIDLHVIDPQGNEFYYANRTYPGTEAKLEEDNTRGPGNEIWLHPRATPGEYEIYYRLFSQRNPSVSVRGALLTPNGREPIPTRDLNSEDNNLLVAVVTVDNDGTATLQVR